MDVLGQAICDFYEEKKIEEIFLKINGEANEPLDPAYFFRKSHELPPLESEALNLATGRILDVGAGAGCHSLILQSQGKDAWAIERSSLACQMMKKQGLAHVTNMDVSELKGEKFDTILLLMNGLGMAQKLKKLPDFLHHLRGLLADGGRIIGDSSDILYWFEQEDGSYLIPADGYYGEVEFDLEYKDLNEKFDWLYVDPNALALASAEAGLEIESITEGDHHDYLAVLSATSR